VRNRLRFDERLLERVRRRDVGRGGAVADHHAKPDASQVDTASRRYLAGLFQFGHQGRRSDDEVSRRALGDGVAQQSGRTGGEAELDPGLLRIVVDHAADHAADGAGRNDLELGRACRRRRQHHHRTDPHHEHEHQA
jgi:hypothetical protein